VLKEKLKAVKARLKVWNKEQFGDTQKKIQCIEREQKKLQAEGDERKLSNDELLTWKKLQEELWIAAQSHESLLRQKARSRWIKERNCSSSLFNRVVNENRNFNTLRDMLVDSAWIDEIGRVKEEICSIFKNIFEEVDWVRPKLDEVRFRAIGHHNNVRLTERISEKEVKEVDAILPPKGIG